MKVVEKKKVKSKKVSQVVKKGNKLNECIVQNIVGTAEEYKMFLMMLSQVSIAGEKPNSKRIYSFYIDDYAQLKGIKDKKDFREASLKMIDFLKRNSTIIVDDGNRKSVIWIFQRVDIIKEGSKLKVEFQLTDAVLEYLNDPRYVLYNLINVLPMKSKYSIRLYELLKQYEAIGKRTFSVDDLRELLGTRNYAQVSKGVVKIIGDEYKDFKYFNRGVIKKALEEINKYSDIEVFNVVYEKDINGKVVDITFYFRKKFVDTMALNTIIDREKYERDIKEIMEFQEKTGLKKLSEDEILFFLINTEEEFDRESVKKLIINALKNKKIENIIGFLIDLFGINIKEAKHKELLIKSSKDDKENRKEENKKEEKKKEEKRDYDTARVFIRQFTNAYLPFLPSVDFNTYRTFDDAKLNSYIQSDTLVLVFTLQGAYDIAKNYVEDIKKFAKENGYSIKKVKLEYQRDE